MARRNWGTAELRRVVRQGCEGMVYSHGKIVLVPPKPDAYASTVAVRCSTRQPSHTGLYLRQVLDFQGPKAKLRAPVKVRAALITLGGESGIRTPDLRIMIPSL